jgi:hypothetical protein
LTAARERRLEHRRAAREAAITATAAVAGPVAAGIAIGDHASDVRPAADAPAPDDADQLTFF